MWMYWQKYLLKQWFYSEYVLPAENVISLRFTLKQANVTNTKKSHYLKCSKYLLRERRISGNYWMIAFSLQTQSNTTVVINPTGLRG